MKTAAAAAAVMLLVALYLAGDAAAQPVVSRLGSCSGLDLREFTIRDARLEDPFWILRWRRPGADILSAVDQLKGKPYTFAAVNAVSVQIERKTQPPDNPDALVQIHYSDIGVVDCRDRQLDVVFRVMSATVGSSSALFEWGSKEKTPNETAGLTRTTAALQIAPEAGFDRARRFTAGGRLQATWSSRHLPFGALIVQADSSPESHLVSASLAGEYQSPTAWLRRADWRVSFDESTAPAGRVRLDDRSLAGHISGASKPIKGIVMRFGGVMDGGHLDSGFAATELPTGTIAGSDFTTSRLFAGATGRGRHQSFAASYGLTLGSTGRRFHGDWRKQIGDIAHEVWVPIGDHRILEIEQRLTAGRLQTIGAVPATERFFGGASDDSQLLGNDWRVPLNPRVRSIPTNGFGLTGAGGDRFVAYNSTIAFTAWRTPVVPTELLRDDEFDKVLRAQLTSARNALDTTYQSEDPRFKAIKDDMLDVAVKLRRVEEAETAARPPAAPPGSALRSCEQALRASRTAANHVITDKRPRAFGWVVEMLPDGNNALANVVASCGVDLVAQLKDSGATAADLEAASNDLKATASILQMRFAAIDTTHSAKRASDDMSYAEHALDVILRQLNITSISPVFLFDVAHIGPIGDDPHDGNRFAIGAGVRFTLASTVNLTATYALNPRRRSTEAPGAFVFSLTTRNLFD